MSINQTTDTAVTTMIGIRLMSKVPFFSFFYVIFTATLFTKFGFVATVWLFCLLSIWGFTWIGLVICCVGWYLFYWT